MSILSDIFAYKNNCKSKLKVCLQKDSIDIFKNNLSDEPDDSVKIEDIIGCVIEESYNHSDLNVYLIINAFPKLLKNKRTKIAIELAYNDSLNKQENLQVVKKWHHNLECLLHNIGPDKPLIEFRPKPFLVFVNPNSGSGNANYLFLRFAVKVWNEANLYNHIIVTQYANHAKEVIKTIDLSSFKAIIVVSGDGLVYEIFNGLLARPDWKEAIKTPVGQIPAGSANALACSVAYLSGENYKYDKLENFTSEMAFYLTKYAPSPLDLISIQLSDKSFVHSFMSVEWAIVADVDLESERFRFLGGLRFFVGALSRVLNLRVYRGKVSFLPSHPTQEYKPKNPSIKILKNTNSERQNSRLENPQLNLKYSYLTPLDEPVPNDWLSIEDKFVLFLILNTPLMGTDFFVSPDTKFDDGSMILVFVREGIPRIQILKLLNDASNGVFLDNPYLEYVKVKAFRLEPQDDGNLMVDGERVGYGPIQGEVLPSFARVLTK